MSGCAPSPGALAAQARKIAGLASPAAAVISEALAGADVAHFDETGFRAAGKPGWVHPASAGKLVLVTVHPERGKARMDAAGVLPALPASPATTPKSPATATAMSPGMLFAVLACSGS